MLKKPPPAQRELETLALEALVPKHRVLREIGAAADFEFIRVKVYIHMEGGLLHTGFFANEDTCQPQTERHMDDLVWPMKERCLRQLDGRLRGGADA